MVTAAGSKQKPKYTASNMFSTWDTTVKFCRHKGWQIFNEGGKKICWSSTNTDQISAIGMITPMQEIILLYLFHCFFPRIICNCSILWQEIEITENIVENAEAAARKAYAIALHMQYRIKSGK